MVAGSEVEVDMDSNVLTDVTSGQSYSLKPLGEVRPTLRLPCSLPCMLQQVASGCLLCRLS